MDIMIDIETTSTSINAGIVALAAVPFDRLTDQVIIPSDFFMHCVPDAEADYDRDTFRWWMSQSSAVRGQLLGSYTCKRMLEEFFAWYERTASSDVDAYVWANGTDFDIAVIKYWAKQYGLAVPWRYNQVRDVRTYKMDLVLNEPDDEQKHNALRDCYYQIRLVREATRARQTTPT